MKGVGLYEKFAVSRTDGSSLPGGKHHDCEYFVLDLDHDPHAIPALEAYIQSCQVDYPLLARDLRLQIAAIKLRGTSIFPFGTP